MTTLAPKPEAPPGVTYALTVPQSVLFADLSLRGNKRAVFVDTLALDYEPRYIDIDNGAMSWQYDLDEPFVELLSDGMGLVEALERFIDLMGRTSRDLDKTSVVLGEVLPEPRDTNALLAALREYWDVYERQMTSLFTFWNIDTALSAHLSAALRSAGLRSELDDALVRFTIPSEDNMFVRERANRARMLHRYVPDGVLPQSISQASTEFRGALEAHASHYGFLLAPFNLGTPPGADAVLESLALDHDGASDTLGIGDLPPAVRRVARLSRQFTFWKSERLDMMALADARMLNTYRAAAAKLDWPVEAVFALTRDELDHALASGSPVLSPDSAIQRSSDYCLVLANGSIGFHVPSERTTVLEDAAEVGAVIHGTPASAGSTRGPVRIVQDLPDLAAVQDGDILVTPMTRPEYGVALDLAAAFVTDEGGRNCHAAIIAREMGKPCVIATGSATRVLRDGMAVDVNGSAGTVTVAGHTA